MREDGKDGKALEKVADRVVAESGKLEDEPLRKFNGAVFFKSFYYPTNLS